MIKPPTAQIPAVYHRCLGDNVVTALSDGAAMRDHQMMRDVAAGPAAIRTATPMGKLIEARDVADAAWFLASPAAGAIAGRC